MKKIFETLFVLLTFFASAYGQDTIITWNRDTISCKVLNANGRFVKMEKYDGSVRTTGKLDRSTVKELLISGKTRNLKDNNLSFNQWEFSLSGGPSHMVGSTKDAKKSLVSQGFTAEQANNYYRQLIGGWSGSAAVHYLIQPDMGVGLNYRIFTSRADEWGNFDPQDGVTLYYGEMKETTYINFLGLSLKSQQPLGNSDRFFFTSAVSAGMTMYRDEVTVLHSNVLLTGKAFGATFNSGIEYFITKHLSLGVNLDLFGSKLRKVKYDNGSESSTVKLSKDQYENVSALDLSAGIRIHL